MGDRVYLDRLVRPVKVYPIAHDAHEFTGPWLPGVIAHLVRSTLAGSGLLTLSVPNSGVTGCINDDGFRPFPCTSACAAVVVRLKVASRQRANGRCVFMQSRLQAKRNAAVRSSTTTAEQTRSRESAEAANAANTSEKNSKMRKPKSNQNLISPDLQLQHLRAYR
ncbi:hypothetical protein BXO8_12890 [Xanthomonas oryzae pv. oryzae]|nr:hypothetical protein BXO8_12890 [Xanthomonas oryzae pv. oryzae]